MSQSIPSVLHIRQLTIIMCAKTQSATLCDVTKISDRPPGLWQHSKPGVHLNLRLRPPCFCPVQQAPVKQTKKLQVLAESLKASFLLEVVNKVLFPADQSSLQTKTQQGLDISVFQGRAELVNNIIVKCIKWI